MPYLEVKIQNAPGGALAISANGISLGKSNGCLAAIFGTSYPMAIAYFEGLEYEGWDLVSSQSSNFVGMIDGFPFANSQGTYVFQGHGRYEVKWDDDGWFF